MAAPALRAPVGYVLGVVPDDSSPHPATPLPLLSCFLVGVVASVLGLLPWLVTGMRLPLQNLWADQAAPEDMPIVLLPFNQYFLSMLAALLVVGGALAGGAARGLRRRLPDRGWWFVLLGLLLTQLFAVVQTSITVRAGLQSRREADLYVGLLVGLAVFAVAVGALALVLLASAPRAGALVGLGIAAVMLAPWLSGLVAGLAGSPSADLSAAFAVVRWVPAVLIGAGIAWAGLGSLGRVLAAAVTLLALWWTPALITAVTSAAGTRVLARHPGEMLEYGWGVFRSAATSADLVLPPLVVAAAVAAIGLWVKRLLPTLVAEDPGSPG